MALTAFGRAVREARRKTKQTLSSMSEVLGVSVAYLSALEVGRNNVPIDFVDKIYDYFLELGYKFDEDLKKLAMVSNKNVPLSGLSFQHQLLVAGFANSSLNSSQLMEIANLLGEFQKSDKK